MAENRVYLLVFEQGEGEDPLLATVDAVCLDPDSGAMIWRRRVGHLRGQRALYGRVRGRRDDRVPLPAHCTGAAPR